MVVWGNDHDFLVIRSHRSQILMQWESIQRIYRDGDTSKVVGHGGAFDRCFLATCGISFDTSEKPAMVEVGAPTPLRDTSRLKCSLTVS